MKRIISLSLSFIILFSMLSIMTSTVYAATDPVAKIVITKNGNEQTLGEYATLDAAFEAVGILYQSLNVSDSPDDEDTNTVNELYAAAGSPVIKLLRDFNGDPCSPDWAVSPYDANNVPTIVIDGAKSATQNYKITCGDITLFDRLAFYNLTVKNTDMVFNRGNTNNDHNIRWNGNLDNSNNKDLSQLQNPRIPGK